jgi:uncharacterized protein
MPGVSLRPAAVASLLMVLLSCTQVQSGPGAQLDWLPTTSIDVEGERFEVRLAETPEARARGFQHVSEHHMHREAIYFHFDAPLQPTFHMRNVAAPLLIAWIDADGAVIGVDLMQPGTAVYGPSEVVAGALEYTPMHPLATQLRRGTRVQLERFQLPP